MSTHEIRFRKVLLGHMTEEEARAFVAARSVGTDRPADWTVAPRKRFELRRGGTVLDTFDTRKQADEALARLPEPARKLPPGFAAPRTEVIDTHAGEP